VADDSPPAGTVEVTIRLRYPVDLANYGASTLKGAAAEDQARQDAGLIDVDALIEQADELWVTFKPVPEPETGDLVMGAAAGMAEDDYIGPCPCFLYDGEAGGECPCGHAADEHAIRGHHATECVVGHVDGCPLDHGGDECPVEAGGEGAPTDGR
jgi:hypothetical protein